MSEIEKRFVTVMVVGKNARPSLVTVEANMARMESLLETSHVKFNTMSNSLGDELYLVSPMDNEVKSLKNITDHPFTCAIARANSHFLFNSLTFGDVGELSKQIFEDQQGYRAEQENVISFYLTRDFNNKLRYLVGRDGLNISKFVSSIFEDFNKNTTIPFNSELSSGSSSFSRTSRADEITQLSAHLTPGAYSVSKRLCLNHFYIEVLEELTRQLNQVC